MKVSGARILVTGGLGMIGSTTIEQLLRDYDPARIVILDNLVRGSLADVTHALNDPRVTLLRGDIRDRDTVTRATEGMDAVVHMAALCTTACAADPREAMEVMYDGSFNVVDAARQAGVKKVVVASTASIYGLADGFPTREGHHLHNNYTWHGASKMMLETLLRSYHETYGLPYVAMRYFNVYGPRMGFHGRYTEVLIRWMERIAAGQPPLIFGNGLQMMDFVYIEDVARSNVLALASDVSNEVFDVASGTETSLRELATALMRVMGAEGLALEYGPERSVAPMPRRLASTEKAQRMLGFRARVGLDIGLRRLVHWWQETREMELSA